MILFPIGVVILQIKEINEIMVFLIAVVFIILPSQLTTSSGENAPTRIDPTIDGIIGVSEYESSKNIDDGKFELFWTTTGGTIYIGMRGETEGYLSLGLDPVNLMTNADMIFGWVDIGGTPHIKDAFCTDDTGNHPEDTSFSGGTFDIDEFDGIESGGTTSIEFRRAMSTGDPYDKKFVNGTEIKIIWATSNDDDWTQEHDDAEFNTMMMDGTAPPPPPPSDELDGIISDGEYGNSTAYDSGNFILHWNINGTNITLGIEALTTGWVSLGISPTTMMLDGDFLIGGIADSTPYAEDHYATTTTAHVLDTDLSGGSNDILAFNSTESSGWTTLEVKRALSTGDPFDKDIILGDSINVIWGVSSSDKIMEKHTKVGYGTWRVNESTPTPPPPPESDFDGVIESGEYDNMTSMDNDRFEIHWTLNISTIDIGIKAQTTGYVSIGIDPTYRMKNADLIFGWVEEGVARSEDHFSTGETGPHSRDEDLGGTFDIISYNGTESRGWTTFEFRRNLEANETYDRTIGTDSAFPLIWAVADTDDPMATHTRRGSIMWNLSNKTQPPPHPPPHFSDFDGIINESEYMDFKVIDQGRFELHWNVTDEEISIGVKAQATGWVSIGIDPSEKMENADMYLGYHDGNPHLLDQFSTGPEGPHPEDSTLGGTDDILDFNVTESMGWTTIEFRRNLTSKDQYDKSINITDLITIIWAVSDSDDPTSTHSRRGTTTWKINENDIPGPPPQKNTTLDGVVSEGEYDESASFGDGIFIVHYTVNGSLIRMAMVGQTEGWLSIGFEPSSMMKDADIIIGWVDGDEPGLLDTFSIGELGPHPVDTDLGGTHDIISYNGTESGGFTTIEFIRELDTDDSYDKVIPSSGSINIIWGLGSSDDPESSHTQRGAGTLLLYSGEPVPTSGLDGVVSQGEYRDSATFDFDNFRVYWTILKDELHMAISAVTTGWISIGFDPEDIMKDSDVILGWVEGGAVHIIDAYSTGQYGPHPPDTHLGGTNDILEYNGTEANGATTLEFVRKVDTGDEYDKVIPTTGNLNVMWAYGEHDDFSESHSQRGFAVLTISPDDAEPPDEPELDGIISDEEYDYNGTFGEGLIIIYWKVEGDTIRMALQGKTTGWVSIGIGYSTAMSDSDMIFGWVENDGTVKVVDAYSIGPTGPHPADTDQGGTNDILSFGGREINGITTIEFIRKLDTKDEKDNPIPINGTLKIIWGIGDSDSFNSMHSRVGYGTITISTGETSSKEPSQLWLYHAILMTLSVCGMIAAWVSQYRKRWKPFLKFHIYVMTASVIIGTVGLILGYIMVESGTGEHMRVLHSWIGVLAIIGSFAALALGLYFKYTKIIKHKRPTIKIHRYAGRIGAGSFVIVALSGFYQAVVLNKNTPESWFIAVIVSIILLFIATIVFLIVKGKKPYVKGTPVKIEKIGDRISEEPKDSEE